LTHSRPNLYGRLTPEVRSLVTESLIVMCATAYEFREKFVDFVLLQVLFRQSPIPTVQGQHPVAVPATRAPASFAPAGASKTHGISTTRIVWAKGSGSELRLRNFWRSRASGWGNTHVMEATRLADLCLDSGVKLFEIADRYYQVASEEILGTAIVGRRDAVLVSTSSA